MRVSVPNIRLEAPSSPVSPVLWFAVLGAPAAWALQFGVGYWISQAKCSPAGAMWGISIDAWIIVLSAIAIPVALGAGLVALAIFRATDDAGTAPPGGRNRFLAAMGMAVTPLFVAIMALNLAGALTYSNCPAG
jgi:heme/copper-type cytochrome/quinol oxidase subunit 2